MNDEKLLELATQLPFPSPSEEEARRLENQLFLRARHTPQRTLPRRQDRSAVRLMAAAASFLLVVVAMGALWRVVKPEAEELPYGVLRASEDASFVQDLARVGGQRHEFVRLEHGRLHVSVRRLRPGDRFLIAVGSEEVEVRGTRFEVVAHRGRLLRVAVEEGRVEVRARAEAARLLLPGDVWHRPLIKRAQRLVSGTTSTLPSRLPRSSAVSRTPPEPSSSPALEASPEAEVPSSPRSDVLEDLLVEAKPKPRPDEPVARPAPVRPRLPRQDVEAAFLRAWQLHKRGQFEAAAELFLLVMDSGDEHDIVEDALYWRVIALESAGRRASAIEASELYLSRYPHASRREAVELRLAWLELARGRLVAARALFQKLTQSDKRTVRTEAEKGLERAERPAETTWVGED